MAELKAFFARVRLPIFSVKHPDVFQIMSCLPVPQPSALVGALAYCIGTFKGSGLDAFKNLKEMIKGGKTFVARAKPMGTMAFSPIVLRRFRVADEFDERKKLYEILEKEGYDEGKSFLERKLMDAFYRVYAMGHEILCVWIADENFEVDEKMIHLLQRLGDTESLVTVSETWVEEVRRDTASKINTSFPFPLRSGDIKRGDFTVTKMLDEKFLTEQFVVPVRHELRRINAGRVIVIEPTEIEVEFPNPTPYCETSEGKIILAG